jgi:TIR domain-containing protein
VGIMNYAGMAVAAFLSYSHDDRKLAGKVKAHLEPFGFDVFLAHEDIEPSVEWQAEIVRQLRTCKVFIALLTDAFDDSDWTHKEVGIAFGRGGSGPPITVPINAGKEPVGFLAQYQAIRLDSSRVEEPFQRVSLGRRRIGPSHIEDIVLHIVKSIASKDAELAKGVRDSLIGRVADISNFDDAGWLFWAFAELNGLSPEQMNQLLSAASDNGDVYGSGSASPYIEQLIATHKEEIKTSVLQRFRRKVSSL